MDYVTQVLLPFDFLCKIGDFELAVLVSLQNKVCLHSLRRHSFFKIASRNQWMAIQFCNNVY